MRPDLNGLEEYNSEVQRRKVRSTFETWSNSHHTAFLTDTVVLNQVVRQLPEGNMIVGAEFEFNACIPL